MADKQPGTEPVGTGASGAGSPATGSPGPGTARGVTVVDGVPEPPRPAYRPRGGTDSQWRLVWRRFRRHRLAMVGATVVLAIYVVVVLADFLAPSTSGAQDEKYAYAPPQRLHFFDSKAGF